MRCLTLFFGFIFIVAFQVPESKGGLRTQLLGNWIYCYSLVDGEKMNIETEIYYPVYKFSFEPCVDSLELNGMPDFVKRIRMKNELKNIVCYKYLNDTSILDTCYPVTFKGSKIGIDEYGRKYKVSYTIDSICNNNLAISNSRVYPGSKKVNHWYKRVVVYSTSATSPF